MFQTCKRACQNAGAVSQLSVEGEFAEKRRRQERALRDLDDAVALQDADGNGQIESRSGFADVRRCQIDVSNTPHRDAISGGFQCHDDALLAFLDRCIAESDDAEFRFASGGDDAYFNSDG